MKAEFVLKKMAVEQGNPVRYYLDMETDFVEMNRLLGKAIRIRHTGYQCLACGSDEPVYARGFCRKCFFEAPQAGPWMIHPEQSKAHLGIEERDLTYEKQIQLAPHIVYLAKTSGIKVGVTQRRNIPDRWIDQGADEALIIMETPNRYLAGITEVSLKAHITDKTRWREMLSDTVAEGDLREVLDKLRPHIPAETLPYLKENGDIFRFNYPVKHFPAKIQSVKLDKNKEWTGTLTGIKGQYLIFEDGKVFNIRNHEGYRVEMEV